MEELLALDGARAKPVRLVVVDDAHDAAAPPVVNAERAALCVARTRALQAELSKERRDRAAARTAARTAARRAAAAAARRELVMRNPRRYLYADVYPGKVNPRLLMRMPVWRDFSREELPLEQRRAIKRCCSCFGWDTARVGLMGAARPDACPPPDTWAEQYRRCARAAADTAALLLAPPYWLQPMCREDVAYALCASATYHALLPADALASVPCNSFEYSAMRHYAITAALYNLQRAAATVVRGSPKRLRAVARRIISDTAEAFLRLPLRLGNGASAAMRRARRDTLPAQCAYGLLWCLEQTRRCCAEATPAQRRQLLTAAAQRAQDWTPRKLRLADYPYARTTPHMRRELRCNRVQCCGGAEVAAAVEAIAPALRAAFAAIHTLYERQPCTHATEYHVLAAQQPRTPYNALVASDAAPRESTDYLHHIYDFLHAGFQGATPDVPLFDCLRYAWHVLADTPRAASRIVWRDFYPGAATPPA